MTRMLEAKEYLKRLLKGNENFYNKDNYEEVDISNNKIESLRENQYPFGVVVSCSDSRITPTIVFNQGLGDLFEIRIAGNVMNEDALGSIEYGVEVGGASIVMVLGHENCGAVKGAIDQFEEKAEFNGNIKYVLKKIEPSVKYVKTHFKEDIYLNTIKVNIKNTLDIIYESPIIKEFIEKKEIILVSAIYKSDGKVEVLEVIENNIDNQLINTLKAI